MVSFGVAGDLFPPWIIFIGTTSIIFPPNNQGKRNYIKMIGTSPLVKTNQAICHKHFPSLLVIINLICRVKKIVEDGVNHKLLKGQNT